MRSIAFPNDGRRPSLAFHALVRIESANAAAFCGLYRLTVHNDD